jgi:hypothetical protein
VRAIWPAFSAAWAGFVQRLREHSPQVFATLHELYGGQYGFFYRLESIRASATELWIGRSAELKALDGLRKWVWTSFHNDRRDLNYEHPVVFNRVLEEVLFLANQGVEIVRLDAVAFLCNQFGTTCRNLPQAHTVIQAGGLGQLSRLSSPPRKRWSMRVNLLDSRLCGNDEEWRDGSLRAVPTRAPAAGRSRPSTRSS